MESILNSVKKILGIEESCTDFDAELILYINAEISKLIQMGIGPDDGFSITGSSETWNEFMDDVLVAGMVKTYIGYRVRMAFDPPTSSFVMDSLNKMSAELEWRMNVQTEVTASSGSTDIGT